MLTQTEEMLEAAKASWWESEVSRLDTAPQNVKWKIINKITESDVQTAIQPIKVDKNFVFEYNEILHEMEQYHIHKDSTNTANHRLDYELPSGAHRMYRAEAAEQ